MVVGLEDVPVLVLERVLDHLEVACAWRLGSASRHFHRLILEQDSYWRRRAKRQILMQLASSEESGSEAGNRNNTSIGVPIGRRALLQDPALNGHKELLKIFASDSSDQGSGVKGNKGRSFADLFKLSLSVFDDLVVRDGSYFKPGTRSHLKLALFGPGIESPDTKHLVHRIVQAHDSCLNAIDFVAGLPGGIGSGVRVEFKRNRVFDLVCLYTNARRLREDHKGVERLLARHNRLLARDVGENEDDDDKGWLHEHVLKVLPTLDVLLFAVNVSELSEAPMSTNPKVRCVKRELEVMLKASTSTSIALVVLCCFNKKIDFAYDLSDLAQLLGLCSSLRRPWALFEVDISNMKGLVNALQWMFYRREKQTRQLRYHYSSSQLIHAPKISS